MLCRGLGKITNDGSVCVEEIYGMLASPLSNQATLEAPSRVMPGLRGTPAGMRTISAPDKASFRPDGVGS